MDSSSQELKHRITEEKEEKETPEMDGKGKGRRTNKTAMAKRGLRSLGFAVGIPLSLTVLDIALFGSNLHYATMKKSFLYPPLWALHLACLGSTFLMGLSAWLVWADGGFHKQPYALFLYLGQMVLGLAWDPIVFRIGASRVGMVMCVALFGALVGCVRMFRTVNPIAGDLVKPCLLWALVLSVVNLKLVYN
ncbi:hypothetical protein M9H77_01655 [Catharanthus roseus]|uniref:Uncharacterized protein n=1 Tax=Catharanthus roseus TaxID=4058 RepID=A0ACC0C6N1_CATRO|nr:hypothetical protein M9H77_01655 [Catharanthus roseus]